MRESRFDRLMLVNSLRPRPAPAEPVEDIGDPWRP